MLNTKCHCNQCGGERNHLILAEHTDEWDEDITGEGDFINGTEKYSLLKCAGCDRVSLKHRSYYLDDPIPKITFYPPREFRRLKPWINELGNIFGQSDVDFIPRLLKEIYGALHSGHLAISAMGIRALLECIMIHQVSDQGSFDKNLKMIESKGLISSTQSDFLVSTLELGHASIHRDYAPNKEDLIPALDIAENLIETIYILPKKAKSLKARIPERKKG